MFNWLVNNGLFVILLAGIPCLKGEDPPLGGDDAYFNWKTQLKFATFAANFFLDMDLQQQFEAAVADSKALSERPSNETLLQLYSLYKQATEGDVNGEAPNMFDFVAKAKYEAWSALKGTSQDAAKEQYISLVNKLKN